VIATGVKRIHIDSQERKPGISTFFRFLILISDELFHCLYWIAAIRVQAALLLTVNVFLTSLTVKSEDENAQIRPACTGRLNLNINWNRKFGFIVLGGVLFVGSAISQVPKRQSAEGSQMSVATPDGLKWVPIRPGNEMAVVYGDPRMAGSMYAVRFRFADGFKVPANWHPQDEHATVLQGTLLLRMGSKWDAAQLTTTMTAGTYIFVPKAMPHFAVAKGETILQAHGIGPFQIIYAIQQMIPRISGRRTELTFRQLQVYKRSPHYSAPNL
jgi:quercetin dioxygenase-like cupin family protein